MTKIVALIVVLGLCANVCVGYAPVGSAQSGAFSSSLLNSTTVTVVKGTNSTDAAVWDSSAAAVSGGAAQVNAGISIYSAFFGPGATNDTSYLWGFPSVVVSTASNTYQVASATSGTNSYGATTHTYTTSVIRKRTINNTIAGWNNDTVEASVVATDASISATIMGNIGTPAVGPGYLAFLSTGYDSVTGNSNNQVWINLVGTSATSTKLTSTADSTTFAAAGNLCTFTSFGLGQTWYNIGTGTFFYTYSKTVYTSPAWASGQSTCGTTLSAYTPVTTIYLGGIYLNGTAYWTTPIMVSAAVAANGVSSLLGGGDNTNAAQNIYLVYQDSTTGIIYSSKTAISANTSAIASFGQLAKAPTATGTASASVSGGAAGSAGTNVIYYYSPAAVWSSNVTYGITVEYQNETKVYSGSSGSVVLATDTSTYGWLNFFNGTTAGVDSGLTSSSTTYGVGGYMAWQLNTGYTVVAGIETSSATSYTLATYFANGTANSTATTVGTLTYGEPQFYEDVNGTMWIGWFDQDIATTGGSNGAWVYNAYLAKFQGQLNIPSSGVNVLSALSFVAVFLASIFIF